MQAEHAIGIGQEALIWLAGQPEALAGLLAASGLAPDTLRARAADPEFLGFVLEFLLGSDAMVRDFAAAHDLPPQAAAQARAALGGELPNWT